MNRVELDRQHLADVDLVIAVGGDGTCLSAAHFLDHVSCLTLSCYCGYYADRIAWCVCLLII